MAAAVDGKGGVPGSAAIASASTSQHAHHHHHHHHHHHTASGSAPIAGTAASGSAGPAAASTAVNTTQTPSTPSLQSHRTKKEDHFLLSLPSQDHEAWYDRGDSSADDGDDENLAASKVPRLSNRGNKLSSGSKFVRKGRLGGWENHEVFKSRSSFPANNVHTLTSGNATSSSKHHQDLAQRALPGGYPIAPHLTLVPSSSTAAARPDNTSSFGLIHDLSTLPPSAANSNGTFLSPRAKRRKHRLGAYTHDGLASTSSSFAAYSSGPVRAYLPAPPQTPIELVMSPLIGKTFSPRNRTLEKLSLGATELIEQDIPLVKALTRLIDFLRGNSIAGEQGIIGLPFIGDSDDVVGVNAKAQDESKDGPHANGHAKMGEAAVEHVNGSKDQVPAVPTEDKTKQNGTSTEGSRKRTRSVSMGEADKEEPPAKRIPLDASAQAPVASAQTVNEVTTNRETVETDAGGPKGEKPETIPMTNGNAAGGQDVEMKEEEQPKQLNNTEGGDSTTANGTAAIGDAGTLPADGISVDDAVNAQVQTNENDLEQGPESRSRSGSVSSSAGGNEEGHDQHRPLVTARLAPSIQRIASPQSYIESLFVTPHDITVPIVAGASAQGGMEGLNNNNNNGGTAGIDTIKLTPNEQLETVRLCLGELTKFLADSLEYQDRLGEIRDSVLGIERRRKGVWNMARGFAHQMLWEEEQDKLANGI